MFDPEKPIEPEIALFFKLQESQIDMKGRTLILSANSEAEFNRLCQFYDEARFWGGIYPTLAITLGDRILTLPLREALPHV